jgi:hypothetical protein
LAETSVKSACFRSQVVSLRRLSPPVFKIVKTRLVKWAGPRERRLRKDGSGG